MMTKVERIIQEEMLQSIAKIEEEKRQIEKEIQQIEKEKRKALKQAKKERKKAIKAEEEKRQAARESVIKMIRKDYPLEEIASIVSGLSKDEIEAVRREITAAG